MKGKTEIILQIKDKIVTWELQGSTDGSTWLTVDKHIDDTNWSSGYSRTFDL